MMALSGGKVQNMIGAAGPGEEGERPAGEECSYNEWRCGEEASEEL